MVVTKKKQNEEQDFYFNVLDLSNNKLKREEVLTELLDSRLSHVIKMSKYDPFKDIF